MPLAEPRLAPSSGGFGFCAFSYRNGSLTCHYATANSPTGLRGFPRGGISWALCSVYDESRIGQGPGQGAARGGDGAGSVPVEEPGLKRPRTAQAPELLAEAALQEVSVPAWSSGVSCLRLAKCPGPTAPRRSEARANFPIGDLAHPAPPLPVRVRVVGGAGAPSRCSCGGLSGARCLD